MIDYTRATLTATLQSYSTFREHHSQAIKYLNKKLGKKQALLEKVNTTALLEFDVFEMTEANQDVYNTEWDINKIKSKLKFHKQEFRSYDEWCCEFIRKLGALGAPPTTLGVFKSTAPTRGISKPTSATSSKMPHRLRRPNNRLTPSRRTRRTERN